MKGRSNIKKSGERGWREGRREKTEGSRQNLPNPGVHSLTRETHVHKSCSLKTRCKWYIKVNHRKEE